MRCLILPALALALTACGERSDDRPAAAPDGTEAFPEQPEPAPAGRFAPRNECIELPGAKQFFVDLEKAIKNRDADALLSLTDADVKLDFGGGGGLTAFRERLEAKDSDLWDELDMILPLGCARSEGGGMVLPWYFAQDLGVDDPFSAMLATGPDVAVRAAPEPSAERVGTVAWDLVTLAEGYSDKPFLAVETRDGKKGYIARNDLRSPVDYRLLVSPRPKDRWLVSAFVAGD